MSICEDVSRLDRYGNLDKILTGDAEGESKHVTNVYHIRSTFFEK